MKINLNSGKLPYFSHQLPATDREDIFLIFFAIDIYRNDCMDFYIMGEEYKIVEFEYPVLVIKEYATYVDRNIR